MGLVLAMMAALWGIGHLMRTPVRLRLGMIFALWAAVILAQLLLPEGHGVRIATGGSARGWLVLGGIAALIVGYRAALRGLRARHATPVAAPSDGRFRPAELERYARHIMLREIGGPGQRRLKDAKVLVVGAGGLGSPALLYLAAAGVGVIGVMDDDVVENSNLQRQIIHNDDRIGMPKAQSAVAAIQALNPFIEARVYQRRLDNTTAALIAEYDLVLDGSDNFDTRYLVNSACVAAGKPLISGAMTQWEGQVGVFDPGAGGPCYSCVFPDRPAPGMVPSCAEAGVVAALPGVIGSMMALEAIKVLTDAGEALRGRVMIYDGLYAEARVIAAKRREACAVCASKT